MNFEDLQTLLQSAENECCEFKEAKREYSESKLAQYLCALANEGGGKFVLGISDRRPRQVVGSEAFPQPEKICSKMMQQLHLNISFDEYNGPEGRVLVFAAPSRPFGTAIKLDGKYWSREGDSLVLMSEDKLRAIFAESGRDFSSEICPGACMDHFDDQAIEDFRLRWITKSRNQQLASLTPEQLLRDAELLVAGGVTYAALILFGSRSALGRFLGQAEVIFEYRSSNATGPAQVRQEFRQGFFSFYDSLWTLINQRNDAQHYQIGPFVQDILTFDERSVREGLLNAVSHRDYQLSGSVFAVQYPDRLELRSPGGLPVGITLENILDRQAPRNRRLADAFSKCGLVERSGQGMNLMVERSIQQGKELPGFAGTDAYNVTLTLHGRVRDPLFVQFLDKVATEKHEVFDTHDYIVLDRVHREEPIPENLKPKARRLVQLGVLESVGHGRGVRYLLSRRFFTQVKRKGEYTRRRGLDREQNKTLLLNELCRCRAPGCFPDDPLKTGCALSHCQEVLPFLGRSEIKRLLGELRDEGKVRLEGSLRWARWHANDDACYGSNLSAKGQTGS